MTVQLRMVNKAPRSVARRIASVAERVLSMDPEALARLRPLPDGVDIFFSTPLGCALSQRLPGAGLNGKDDDGDSTVVRAAALKDALQQWADSASTDAGAKEPEAIFDLGTSVDMMWLGALPPVSGFQLVDWVPAEELREVYREMEEEHELRGGPTGLAPSMLDQELVEVTSEAENNADQQGASEEARTENTAGGAAPQLVNITGRMVATAGATGVISPPPAALQEKYPGRQLDVVRVAATGSWIRLDGVFGTLYAPRPGGLARLP